MDGEVCEGCKYDLRTIGYLDVSPEKKSANYNKAVHMHNLLNAEGFQSKGNTLVLFQFNKPNPFLVSVYYNLHVLDYDPLPVLICKWSKSRW